MRSDNHISLLEKRVVEQCSPTLAGLKTGSLFSLRGYTVNVLLAELRNLNRRLRSSGLLLIPLKKADGFALMYLYRPGSLQKDLKDPLAGRILRDFGYRPTEMTHCILRLCSRLKDDESFPHEIGLFLGYPPKDVDGFIHHKDRSCVCSCKGCWKVYSDPEKSEKLFRRFRQCTACYLERFNNGSSLEQLLVSGL